MQQTGQGSSRSHDLSRTPTLAFCSLFSQLSPIWPRQRHLFARSGTKRPPRPGRRWAGDKRAYLDRARAQPPKVAGVPLCIDSLVGAVSIVERSAEGSGGIGSGERQHPRGGRHSGSPLVRPDRVALSSTVRVG